MEMFRLSKWGFHWWEATWSGTRIKFGVLGDPQNWWTRIIFWTNHPVLVRNQNWLVVFRHPSEKYESVGIMTFPTEWKVIKMFQTTNQKMWIEEINLADLALQHTGRPFRHSKLLKLFGEKRLSSHSWQFSHTTMQGNWSQFGSSSHRPTVKLMLELEGGLATSFSWFPTTTEKTTSNMDHHDQTWDFLKCLRRQLIIVSYSFPLQNRELELTDDLTIWPEKTVATVQPGFVSPSNGPGSECYTFCRYGMTRRGRRRRHIPQSRERSWGIAGLWRKMEKDQGLQGNHKLLIVFVLFQWLLIKIIHKLRIELVAPRSNLWKSATRKWMFMTSPARESLMFTSWSTAVSNCSSKILRFCCGDRWITAKWQTAANCSLLYMFMKQGNPTKLNMSSFVLGPTSSNMLHLVIWSNYPLVMTNIGHGKSPCY